MKPIFKILLMAILGMAALLPSCSKKDALTYWNKGTAIVLKSSTTTIAAKVTDSSSTALVLNWTNPHYATDSSTVKYTIQIDSSGRNFSKAVTMVVSGALVDSISASQINNIALGFGFSYNVAYNMDVRVISSYANNNEQLNSNVITINVTPYVTPPKVTPPSSKTLFIVGSATAGGWGNPVPVPAQQFTLVDSVHYQGTFFLNAGGQYLLLPVNTNTWSTKYAVADNSVSGLSAGGSFGVHVDNQPAPDLYQANFPAPAVSGMYTISVDFQHGKFTVVLVQQYGLLWVPGEYQSSPNWTPASAPQLGSPKNDGNYEGYINITTTTNGFKFASEADWNGTNYGDTAGNGQSGILSTSGNNLNIPVAGYYKINANIPGLTWSATAIHSWGIIGSFATSNWNTEAPMTFNAGTNTWTGTITTAAGDQFKFRANNDPTWTINLGESGGHGTLAYGGDNIGDPTKNFAIPPGTHTIILYMGNPGYYTYTIQ
ncbi:MAG: SusE domain-containing protein [Bacteroidetes bacterium]|nr:SusE domain-containing protein [Bacteroidota bacterium]